MDRRLMFIAYLMLDSTVVVIKRRVSQLIPIAHAPSLRQTKVIDVIILNFLPLLLTLEYKV